MTLTADFRRESGVLVAYLRGQIVFGHEVDAIARQATSLGQSSKNLVLHLGMLGEVRSSDVGALWLQYMQAQAAGWKIKLTEIPAHLLELMRQTRIDGMFEVYSSEADAIASFIQVRAAVASDSAA